MPLKNLENVHELSPLQRGMLFRAATEPESGAYFIQLAFDLEGELDAAAFRGAWERTVAHHPALRSSFAWEGVERPLQLVHRAAALPWVDQDWRGAPDLERRFAAFLADDRAAGFALTRAPLARAALLRTGDAAWRFAWSAHHLVVDGWSLPLVLRDVLAAYHALRAGAEPALPARRPFADYVGWVAARGTDEAEGYWRGRLAGVSPTPFPAPPRAGAPAGQGTAALRLSAAATDALAAFAREARVTPATVVQGAWALLLARMTGEDDVTFGTVVSGRPAELAGVEEMVGMFVQTLPARVAVDGREPAGAWLRRLQAELEEGRRHGHVPPARLRAWSGGDAGAALFDTLVAFENFPLDGPAAAGGLSVRLRPGGAPARVDAPLALVAVPGPALELSLAHDRARMDDAEAARLLARFARVLASLAGDPARPLARVSLASAEERETVAAAWNATDARYPGADLPLHRLVEAQAARTPDAVAVVFEGRRVTYAALNARANRLARRLRARGVGPETPVAVYLERGVEMVASLLGVLKAGGAYVPVDPGYPASRVAHMLADSAAPVVLTSAELASGLPQSAAHVLLAEVDHAEADGSDPEGGAGPDHLAYAIYTSGSTGLPKGAMNAHRGVVNRILWMQAEYGLTADDAVLQKTPFSFDVSVWEFFWPLVTGARLVVARPGGHRDPGYLAGLIEREGITTLHFVPSMLRAFLDEADAARCRSLRRVVCSGEALPADLAARFHETLDAGLHNLYGPTEAAVDVTYWPCAPGAADAPVPIGRPVANTRVYVLDAAGEPVPARVPGELYLGGVQVGRGYLRRPALTAEKFVPDPFSPTPGARLYRTGDRARRRTDGALEFLGRLDFQVKVRGFRIEPGEIEAVLRAHPSVRDAAVVARDDGPGGARLVAYAATGGATPDLPALRAWLGERLPEHMVPAAFVAMDALPLSPSGKLDRRALPAPAAAVDAERGHVAPRTPAEQAVADVLRAVLRVEAVGAEDDFFALGGDSILALRVASRLRAAGLAVTPRDVFEARTVAAIARVAPPAASVDEAPVDAVGSARRAASVDAVDAVNAVDAVDADAPADMEDAYALTPLQEGMLFHTLYDQGGGTYVSQFVFDLAGEVDEDALAAAWAGAVARHPALRTAFVWQGVDSPRQVVARVAALPFARHDWRGGVEVEARLAAWLDEDRLRGFDMGRAPLLRLALFHVADGEWRLAWTFHHAVLDGWSLARVVADVLELYRREVGAGAGPGAPPRPFRDYVDWLALRPAAASESFWRGYLDGFRTPTALPFDRPAAPEGRDGFGHARVHLGDAGHEALRTFARRHGVTANTVVQGAWALLLSRYTGEDDVVFGNTVLGRPAELPGAEETVGLFINTLPVRVTPRPGERVAPWLHALQARQLALREHEHTPLVQVRAWSAVPAGEPLFESNLGFHDVAPDELEEARGLPFALRFRGAREQSTFPITVGLSTRRGTLVAEYARERFDDAAIERMLGQLRTIVLALAADPDRRLRDLPLLADEERPRVLEEWNRSASAHPATDTVDGLFAAQVRRTPDAPALAWRGGAMSYAELGARADRVARRLRALGAGPESRVGICLERGAGLVAAILGTLRAGAAYVPLDPAYPRERLAWVAADAGLAVLVTRPGLEGAVDAGPAPLLLLDAEEGADEAAADAGDTLAPASAPANLAYVIYTSGSTGRPKGVGVEHGPAAAHFLEFRDFFALGPGERVLLFASASFDASVEQIFPTLLSGAALVLPGDETWAPAEFLARCAALGVTVTDLPSVYWQRVVVETPPGQDAGPLRVVMSGGEALPADSVRQWASGPARAVHLYNAYGPTEAVVTSTAFPLRAETAAAGSRRVPIGPPFPQRAAYVADAHGNPLPAGVPGELRVGGPLLARGYLGRPALTADRFVPDPFGGAPGARLYRTGDQVRWLDDGTLDILGRVDNQVKVRGFRIEPEEIEVVLVEHPGVREAVVAARPDAGGETLLAAWVVGAEGGPPAAAELRAFLGERLPAHMVPAAFVAMETLPLTRNGKVDRRALPAPVMDEAPAGEAVAPRTEPRALLAALFGEVLGVGTVGVRDDFFALGGHSLRATRLVARVREAFAVDLPLRDFFENPTVEALAARLAELRRGGAGVPPLAPAPRDRPLPLSFAQRRLWFVDRLEPGRPDYNLPVAIRLEGPLDEAALERALAEIVRRHEVLRTAFRDQGGEPVQEPRPADVRLRRVDLGPLPEAEREARLSALIEEEELRPFDLSRGPLFRAALVRTGHERSVLLFTLHHVAADEWSAGVLVREANAAYAAYRAGAAPELPPLPVQYADYAAWQRGWLAGEALERETAWWKERLAGLPATLDLPFDGPRADGPPRGAARVRVVGARAADRLRARARAAAATPFMALVAAFSVVLRHLTGADDLAVGTNAANRERPELEGVIGFFVNQLVLRADLSGDPTLGGVLARVREATLGAFAHQDLPYERLVDALRPERGEAPLFHVKVDYGDGTLPPLELEGVTARHLPRAVTPVRYDLLLGATDRGEGGPLELAVTYDARRFRAETVDALLAALEEALDALAAEPELPLPALLGRLEAARAGARAERQSRLREASRERLRARPRPVLDPIP